MPNFTRIKQLHWTFIAEMLNMSILVKLSHVLLVDIEGNNRKNQENVILIRVSVLLIVSDGRKMNSIINYHYIRMWEG